MANRNFGQDARIMGEGNLDGNRTESFSNDSTEDMIDDEKETLVPISELRKTRSEAAKYRKELQSLKGEIDEEKRKMELSGLEEMERLKASASKAETELGSLKGKIARASKESAIINAASILGFCSPKDAVSLIEFSQLDIDEEGNVDEESAFDLVKDLGDSKPYLRKGQSKLNFGPTNPAPKNGKFPKAKSGSASQIEQMKYQARDLTKQGRILEATKLFNRAWEEEHGVKR